MIKNIMPNLLVEDVDSSITFYTTIFGFEVVDKAPSQHPQFALLKQGEHFLMFHQKATYMKKYPELKTDTLTPSISLFVEVEAFDRVFQDAQAQGCLIRNKQKTFYGSEEYAILDPSGYVIIVGRQK